MGQLRAGAQGGTAPPAAGTVRRSQAPQMRLARRQLGRTELKVPVLCFGAS